MEPVELRKNITEKFRLFLEKFFKKIESLGDTFEGEEMFGLFRDILIFLNSNNPNVNLSDIVDPIINKRINHVDSIIKRCINNLNTADMQLLENINSIASLFETNKYKNKKEKEFYITYLAINKFYYFMNKTKLKNEIIENRVREIDNILKNINMYFSCNSNMDLHTFIIGLKSNLDHKAIDDVIHYLENMQ